MNMPHMYVNKRFVGAEAFRSSLGSTDHMGCRQHSGYISGMDMGFLSGIIQSYHSTVRGLISIYLYTHVYRGIYMYLHIHVLISVYT